MNALATKERPQTGRAQPETPHLFEAGSPARSSLEDDGLEGVILRAWEDLAVRGTAECPVCGGTLRHSGCDACGSELA